MSLLVRKYQTTTFGLQHVKHQVLLGNTHSCYICLISSAESILASDVLEVESQGVY
jgi:hypothetical protein